MALGDRFRSQLETVQRVIGPTRGPSRAPGRDDPPVPVLKQPHLQPIVTVFGAGIAGLSAAHELIERGFYVQVVEPASSPDEEYAAEVGGLARNQFVRVPENPDTLHATAKKNEPDSVFREHIDTVLRMRSRGMRAGQPRIATPWRIRFERSTGPFDPTKHQPDSPSPFNAELEDDWGVRNGTKLTAVWDSIRHAYATYDASADPADNRAGPGRRACKASDSTDALPQDWLARERLFVEIRGHSDGDRAESENRKESEGWAQRVFEQLGELNKLTPIFPADNLESHFEVVGVGSAEPLGDQRFKECRRRSNRVEFRIVEQLLPGEHGYRFFPAFYRHLFDVMRRTPILGRDGDATGQTAFDLLVPTTQLGIAVGDNRPLEPIETRRVESLEELRKLSELFLGRLGVTHRDIVRFQTRLIKYLTSSPERRSREYERQSWWTFIGGDDERGYSGPMRKYLMETSQALVAMNAEETDARSQGNIVAQLQLHYLENQCDYTLNGPTSDVWLRPWKKYLQRQGVRFFVGELAALKWEERDDGDVDLVPVTSQSSAWLAPARKPRPQAASAPAQATSTKGDPLVARRRRDKIEIEVIDNDEGDYTVVVSGALYTFAATGQDVDTIASHLTRHLKGDPRLSVTWMGARMIVRARGGMRLSLGTCTYHFNPVPESSSSGRTVALSAKAMQADAGERKGRLTRRLETFQKEFDEKVARGDTHPQTPSFDLDDADWIAAGRLRVEDPDFNALLTKHETTAQREVVPCFAFHETALTLDIFPPPWVEAAIAAVDQGAPNRHEDTEFLCPYDCRVSGPTGATSQSPSGPDWARQVISVQVRNAHGNLRIADDPIGEDPKEDYLSPSERESAFRPDFYVLALPLTEASKLLWRTEKALPGRMHGSLAEVLEFDQRSGRRTSTGVPIRLIRDAEGRPPLDYPLRDFAGIQYYFHNRVRIGSGHIYYPKAEWGLSSISQLAYWRERMSPASPFIGQLSVDIGDFYRRAPARHGTRVTRSAWNSSSSEIAEGVWFQVRQSLEREHAGILVAPTYYHLDQGLSFDHALGSVFRDRVSIRVWAPPAPSTFTVWVHGHRVSCEDEVDARKIADALATSINEAAMGAVCASVEQDHSAQECIWLLVLCSTLPEGTALLHVAGDHGGLFEVSLKTSLGKPHVYGHVQPERPPDAGAVRDGLFGDMVRDSGLPVIAEKHGLRGIRLLPRRGDELPRITVRNDQQELRVIYGARLEVRLDQRYGCLSFVEDATATIGENTTPFLINVPTQWQYRPGLLRPDDLTFDQTVLRPGADDRIRYRISNQRWVAVGTHMATTTQLTTMEAANESARHAVNAILRCLASSNGTEYNAQGRVFADLAEVWDPEKHELDDLAPLRHLDSKLAAEGLPHVMDILKISEAVDAIPMHGKPSQDPFANVLHLVQHLADGVGHDWGFAKQTLNDLLGQVVERANGGVDPSGLLRDLRHGTTQVAERLREVLQGLAAPPGGPAGPKPGPGT